MPDKEVSNSIQSGQVKFYDVESAQLKRVLKTFVLESDWRWVSSLDGQNCLGRLNATKILLEQLARIESTEIWVSLLLSVQQEILSNLEREIPAMAIPSKRKWINDTFLFQRRAIDKAPKRLLTADPDGMIKVMEGMLIALLQLISMPKDVDHTNGMRDLATSFQINRMPDYAICLGRALSMLATEKLTNELVQALDAILQEADENHIIDILAILWNECPEIAIESGWTLLSSKRSPQQILSVLRDQLLELQPIESTLHAAANYVTRLSYIYPNAHKEELLITQLEIGSQYYRDDPSFREALVENIVTTLTTETKQHTSKGALSHTLEGLRTAHDRMLHQIEDKQKQMITTQDLAIAAVAQRLQAEIDSHSTTQSKLEDLRSGTYTPGAIAKVQGQLEVLQALARYHQELSMGTPSMDSTLNTKATIMQIGHILSQFTVTIVGNPGDTESFNPGEHIPLKSVDRAGAPVEIVAPGFRWTNSNGEQSILIRASVSPVNPDNHQ
jgi:hypothetical protein